MPKSSAEGLTRNWDFNATKVPRWLYRSRLEVFFKNIQWRPKFVELLPVTEKSEWAVYFIYAPDGRLNQAHEFTLGRLRDCGLKICVICAAPDASFVPDRLRGFVDALYWKHLKGYDFSAYAIALEIISKSSPHARVLFMNDSVFGPFSDLRCRMTDAPWDFTGFTASSQFENHIQSYAFVLRDVASKTVRSLSSVLFPMISLKAYEAVTLCQETRLARVASRNMSVGSYWFGDANDVLDPVLVKPFELIKDGFPFLKKSLIGKHRKFNPDGEAEAFLASQRHPRMSE